MMLWDLRSSNRDKHGANVVIIRPLARNYRSILLPKIIDLAKKNGSKSMKLNLR